MNSALSHFTNSNIKVFAYLLILLHTSFPANASYLSSFVIAEIDWCPQICTREHKISGYISEIIDEIVSELPIYVERKQFPWSRAIVNVTRGKSIALSAPAKSEAPELLYPEIPIGIQKMCFFKLNESNWRYTGVDSLKNQQLGMAKDTSIEELNEYVIQHPRNFQLQPYHGRFIYQNIQKLIKGRIDAFIFTRNSTLYEINNLKLRDIITEAGCVSSAPVYIAFTPALSQKNESLKLMKLFDVRMRELWHSKKLDEILSKYNVGFSSEDLMKHAKP